MQVTLSPDGHTVVYLSKDGVRTEQRFSSHAEARHTVERATGLILPVESHQMPTQDHWRKQARIPKKLSAEQKTARKEALKRFKGVTPVD